MGWCLLWRAFLTWLRRGFPKLAACVRFLQMNQYQITGGMPVSGVVRASGNKNAALPCIVCALLGVEDIILRNIPNIEDVRVMLDVFCSLGGKAENIAPNAWKLGLTVQLFLQNRLKKYVLRFYLPGRCLPGLAALCCRLPEAML